MKTKLKLLAALLLLSTLNPQLSTALAQGTMFTYQGRLNSGTNPASGSYDLTFSLFSTASGAGQVGNTVTNSTGVSNGLFTATLDFGANYPGADRWLEIGVRTNGGGAFTTLSPRQKLTPTPYAVTAANLSGTLPSSQLPANVAKLDANEIFTGQVNFNGGNVGVGTISPSDKLDIIGGLTTRRTTAADVGGSLALGAGNYKWLMIGNQLNGGDFMIKNPVGANVMYFPEIGGNVGIGTSTPQSPLEVVRPITFSSADDYPQMRIKSASGDLGKQLGLGVDEAASVAFVQALDRGQNVMPLSLQRYGGKVGIGTTTIPAELTIDAPMNTSGLKVSTHGINGVADFVVDHPGGLGFGNGLNLYNVNATPNDVTGIFGYNASGVAVAGIEFVNVNHGSVGTRVGAISFTTLNTGEVVSRAYMAPDGKFGIGTTTPAQKLDVAGAVAINGTTIISASGQWVGSPTGLVGPQGPQGIQGPQGVQGPVGAAGATGSAGVDGKTVRSGSGVPSSGLGVNGDFYINTTADTIYGPKTNGAWGSATSLIGPQGPQGPTIHTVAMCTGSYLASDDATGCATVCGGAAKVSAHGGAYCTAVPDTGVTCSQNLISGYGICCVCIP